MMDLLRRLADRPGLRRVLLQPQVRRVLASILALRFLAVAGLVRSPARFVVDDLVVRRGRIATWTLRDGGQITLRHRRDTETFHEIFRAGEYDPPAALAAATRAPARVLDIGANIGLFATWALQRWPQAQVTSLEPEPDNLVTLRAAPALRNDRFVLVPAAAGTADGTLTWSGGSGSGAQFLPAEDDDDPAAGEPQGPRAQGHSVPAIDVFGLLAEADLVKLDIEGGEWPLLADPRLAGIGATVLVMEYHRSQAPSLPARDAAVDLLERAGFEIVEVHPNHWGHGILWAYKRG